MHRRGPHDCCETLIRIGYMSGRLNVPMLSSRKLSQKCFQVARHQATTKRNEEVGLQALLQIGRCRAEEDVAMPYNIRCTVKISRDLSNNGDVHCMTNTVHEFG